MVVTQEHKTYFVSSRLRLPHGLREVSPAFCHINYVNINWVSANGRINIL